jgi:DNA-binding NtrC family response regulator
MLNTAQASDQACAQDRESAQAKNRRELESVAVLLVGHLDLDGMRLRLGRAMLCEALRRTRGNYTHAAMLLGVRRQAVQQMVRRMELETWALDLKRAEEAAQGEERRVRAG